VGKFLKRVYVAAVAISIVINIFLLFFARHAGNTELQFITVGNLFLLSLIGLCARK